MLQFAALKREEKTHIWLRQENLYKFQSINIELKAANKCQNFGNFGTAFI